jgi:hypothetical protein
VNIDELVQVVRVLGPSSKWSEVQSLTFVHEKILVERELPAEISHYCYTMVETSN